MIVASVVMIIIAVNMLITILIISYLMDLIVERFKKQNEFDDSVEKHIYSIYDIINYNRLAIPRRNSNDERSKSNNQEGHKEV